MLAAGVGITGMTIGYKRPYARRSWLSADMIWLFAPVLTLGAALTGVENHLTGQRIEQAQEEVIRAHRQLLAKSYDAVDSACQDPATITSACAQWTNFQRSIAIPGMSMKVILEIASRFSEIEHSERTGELGQNVAQQQGELFEELKKYNDLKTNIEDISIFLPYAYIFFMSFALGFRAAAGGAELAKIHAERIEKLADDSYFHTVRKKLRLKKIEKRNIKKR